MATDRLDDDGGAVVEPHVVGWDDIAYKIDWEGWPDSLDWFKVTEVPKEGRPVFAKAKRLKAELDAVKQQLDEFLPELGW